MESDMKLEPITEVESSKDNLPPLDAQEVNPNDTVESWGFPSVDVVDFKTDSSLVSALFSLSSFI